ncbi:MAG: SPASM domain-containing protein [Treponema sp.]|jgi:uncharacterized protein|nr:SPASM domain-containing protein [Treponema sp.]
MKRKKMSISTDFYDIFDIDGSGFLFNIYTSSLIKLDAQAKAKLLECKESNNLNVFSQSEYEILQKELFIVDESDERSRRLAIKNSCHTSKYKNSSVIKIDIALTNKCNFICPYCYEKKILNKNLATGDGCNEYIQKLKRYTLHSISSTTKTLEVVFYGGEPLLEKEFMTQINDAFVDISNSTGVEYKSVLITNGSLLDYNIINILKSHLDYIQITVDGMKETRNSRRTTSFKEDTFTKIIGNIKFLLANDIDVSIRINVDKSNAGSALDLLDFLHDSLGDGRYNSGTGKYNVDIARTSGFTASFSLNEYVPVYAKLAEKAFQRHQIDLTLSAPPLAAFCTAETQNANIVLDNFGNIYKCWDRVYEEHDICNTLDNILNGHPANLRSLDYIENVSLDAVNNGKCMECKYINHCGGFCPKIRMNIKDGETDNIYKDDMCKKYIYSMLKEKIKIYLKNADVL